VEAPPHPARPRVVVADNAGPFTLDGTRTHIVGSRTVAVVDPGPDEIPHVGRLREAVEGADSVVILVTHGHADHAGVAARLGNLLAAEVRGFGRGARPFSPGEKVFTDAGSLIPLLTPGHTRDHYAFHWPEARAVFPGDLLLGSGDTTWVAEYPGCVADYLASLDALERTGAHVLFPAHGPSLENAPEAVRRFRLHRLARIAQVEAALAVKPRSTLPELLDSVYGPAIPEGVREAARKSLEAILHHLGR
jgi:glyoxylase-like metal-dependent hydrolase (beta-lactamase superfamily II)